MELQVRLEPLAVLGQPVFMSGWVCGTLAPPGPDSWLIAEYGDKRVLRRRINQTEDLLLGYINLQIAGRGPRLQKQLCSVVARYGIFEYTWTMPRDLPRECAEFWRNSEKYHQIPFAIPSTKLIEAAREPAAMLDHAIALREGDATKIAAAQAKLGDVDPDWALVERVAPDFGLSSLAQRLTRMLRERPATEGTTIALGQREDGAFVMTISAESLKEALILALCDHLASTYRRCTTCKGWFPPKENQVHCSRQCRTRSSVYRLRAVDAVKRGMAAEEAAKRYAVPISELNDRLGRARRKPKQKPGRRRSGTKQSEKG